MIFATWSPRIAREIEQLGSKLEELEAKRAKRTRFPSLDLGHTRSPSHRDGHCLNISRAKRMSVSFE
jgi:hypothetical protein